MQASSHVSHRGSVEMSCVRHSSVHKAAVKSEEAQKAVVLWLDSPASQSQISASLSGSSQKQPAVSEQGALWQSYSTARFQSHLVCEKKQGVCVTPRSFIMTKLSLQPLETVYCFTVH